ncbi:hypothetical protein EDB87DRAFT_1684062 [Lactarius vividus]|nr:hypothetical protein EDB87DRAFT_1684062 [Lactarius vividus]
MVHDNYTLQVDLARGEHPDYFKFIGYVPSAHFVPSFSKMVLLNRGTNPKDLEVVNHGLGTQLTMAAAINHRALLNRSLKDHSSYPLSKTEIGESFPGDDRQVYVLLLVMRGTGADRSVGGFGTQDTIKSRLQVNVLQLPKRTHLDNAQDMAANSSLCLNCPPTDHLCH